MEDFLKPEQCERLYETRDDFNDHDWYWAIPTPETKIFGEKVEAMLTTKAMLEKRPEEFDDMKIVPAYKK